MKYDKILRMTDGNRSKDVDLSMFSTLDEVSMSIIQFFRPYRNHIDEEFSKRELLKLLPDLLKNWDWSKPFEYTDPDMRDIVVSFYLMDR